MNACHKGFIDFFIFLSHILPLLHFVVVFFPPHIPSHPVSLSIALSAYPSAYLQVYWMNSVVFVLYQIHLLEKYCESAIYETVSVFLFIKVCVEVYKLRVRERKQQIDGKKEQFELIIAPVSETQTLYSSECPEAHYVHCFFTRSIKSLCL